MAVSREFEDYLDELFGCMPGSHTRRMFGGIGVFRQGLMYGLATGEGRVAVKGDAESSPDYVAEGAEEWIYEGSGKLPKRMGYWYVPDDVLEDRERFGTWAGKAFDAAVRLDNAKPPSQRKWKG